jgi:hypothetical protein
MDEGLWELEEMVLKEFNVPVRPQPTRPPFNVIPSFAFANFPLLSRVTDLTFSPRRSTR